MKTYRIIEKITGKILDKNITSFQKAVESERTMLHFFSRQEEDYEIKIEIENESKLGE